MYKELSLIKLKDKKIFLLLAVTFGLLLFTLSRQASAQEILRTFTVSPPVIETTIKPGGYMEGKMKIFNESTTPLTFDASLQDFIVDNDEGRPTILQEDTLSNKYSASSWIAVYPHTFTVQPKERFEVSYYINVPKNARPGGRYATVVFKPRSSLSVAGTGTAVQTQIGSLFYISVDGPITEKAEVTKFDAKRFVENGPITIFTSIKNLSDLHIRPKGYIKVINMLGKQSYVTPLTEYNIFPEAQRNYENTFGKKFMFGRYKAELIASYGKNNNLPLTATIYFWVFPWKIVLILIVIIITAVLGYLYMKKNKKTTGHLKETTDTRTSSGNQAH